MVTITSETHESVQSALTALAAYTPFTNNEEAGHLDPSVLLQMFIKRTASLERMEPVEREQPSHSKSPTPCTGFV